MQERISNLIKKSKNIQSNTIKLTQKPRTVDTIKLMQKSRTYLWLWNKTKAGRWLLTINYSEVEPKNGFCLPNKYCKLVIIINGVHFTFLNQITYSFLHIQIKNNESKWLTIYIKWLTLYIKWLTLYIKWLTIYIKWLSI
jgi:hypothetical protein